MSAFTRLRARRKSSGIAIITAIFLLVVVAGLGVAVVSLTTAQQDASAKYMLGLRAYQAARAGVEWALFTGLQAGGANPPQPSTSLGCGSNTTMALPGTTLNGFRVTVAVTCDGPAEVSGVAGGGANDPTAFHVAITSTACNQPANGACPNPAPGPDYVQRVLNAQL